MNDFVDQCRRQWRRLGVADQAADEMASELAADLEEAESHGLSPAEYLGAGASDAPAFAAVWARERGLIPGEDESSRRPRFLLPFTVLSGLLVIVAGLLLITGEPKVSLVGSRRTPFGGVSRQVVHSASAAAPVEWVLLVLALLALTFAGWLWSSWHRTSGSATTSA